MMEGRIPGTGHLERVVFNSRGQEIRRESLLQSLHSRVTGVAQGPDGYLYILLDEGKRRPASARGRHPR